MDFQGQRLAEQLLLWLMVGFAVGSFAIGFVLHDFQLMVKLNGVGLVVTLLTVLPNWPFYNRNPVSWLPPLHPPSAQPDKPEAKKKWF